VTRAGAEVIGHFHVLATKKVNDKKVPKTMDQIASDTRALIPEISKALSVRQ